MAKSSFFNGTGVSSNYVTDLEGVTAEAKGYRDAAEASAISAEANAQQIAADANVASTNAASAQASATLAANSVSDVADSATQAANSQSAAAISATQASLSASTASTSAFQAAGSEGNASTSETNAATSETNAATSASNAATSETNAATSETNAATSATAAQTAQTAAELAETNAETAETNAATSATNAATSATNASTSASTASTKASEAATSATNAATSETNAATSATNSATNAANAATSETNAAASATAASTSASQAAASAASVNVSAFATAAQGVLADTAVQPNDDPTLNIVTITNEIEFEGDTGSNALIQKNASTGRDELQIYAGGDAYQTGSRGAGIHLYGNSDSEHAGNFAVMTGPDDNGDGRIIASGREDKTHVTIGNAIFNYVDVGDDHALLNLKGADAQPALLIEGAGSTEGDIVTVTGEAMQFGHWDKASTTFTERMRIASSGSVGIGTSDPDGLLDVYNDAGAATVNVTGSTNTIIRARQTGNTGLGYFSFGRSDDIFVGGLVYDHDGDTMRFNANNAERMRIDSNGDVGINVTSPAAPLHINSGAGNLTAVFESSDAGAAILLVDNSTTGGVSAENGLQAVGDQLEVRAVDNLSFETNGAERIRIDSSGNVGIDKTNPATALDVNGTVTATRFHSAEGTVRAWVNYNGQSTVSIRDSGNVSTITDLGVGDFRINFTNPYSNASYAMSGSGASTVASSDTFANAYSFATSSVTVGVNSVTGTLVDRAYITVTTVGNQ